MVYITNPFVGRGQATHSEAGPASYNRTVPPTITIPGTRNIESIDQVSMIATEGGTTTDQGITVMPISVAGNVVTYRAYAAGTSPALLDEVATGDDISTVDVQANVEVGPF